VGGKYTKSFEKLGYNIKIKKGNLLERKNLRLRTEAVDPSFLREKVAYDICNVIGLPSLSLNYARVFFNDKYMGLYALRDAFKAQWIEYTFGEKNTKHLYTCDGQYMTEETENLYNCINDDENIKDDPDWKHFIERLKAVKTRADLEEFYLIMTSSIMILPLKKINGFQCFMILIVTLVPIEITKPVDHFQKKQEKH